MSGKASREAIKKGADPYEVWRETAERMMLV